jgi:cytochrome c oxidase subunit IV
MSVSMQSEHKGAPLEAHHEAHSKPHPRDRDYVVIAIILGLITALEIAFYFLEDDLGSGLVIGGLITMMIVKFAMVAAYFMHLKFDNPMFRRVFVFGLLLAIGVYIAALTSMHFWS